MLIVCCDGLNGLPDAIEATWPRRSCRPVSCTSSGRRCGCVGYKDRKAVAAALGPSTPRPTVEAAAEAIDELRARVGRPLPGDREGVARPPGNSSRRSSQFHAEDPQGRLHDQPRSRPSTAGRRSSASDRAPPLVAFGARRRPRAPPRSDGAAGSGLDALPDGSGITAPGLSHAPPGRRRRGRSSSAPRNPARVDLRVGDVRRATSPVTTRSRRNR